MNINSRKNYKIKLTNIEIAISEWGDENARPILALHGWMDNMATYYPMIEQSDWLEENNIRFIAVDWAGHGESAHRGYGNSYHFVEYVQDLHDLIDALDLKEVNILGHSLGGSIATLYAGSYPERVNRLMLIEGLGPLTKKPEEGPEQLAKAITQRLEYINKNAKPRYYPAIEPIVKARSFNNDINSKNATRLVERNLQKSDKGYSWRSDPRLKLASHMMLTTDQVDAFIKNLSIPVMLIYGEEGFVKRFPRINEMVALHPHVTAVKQKGGHHLHMEHPKQTIEAILKFMNKNRGQSELI